MANLSFSQKQSFGFSTTNQFPELSSFLRFSSVKLDISTWATLQLAFLCFFLAKLVPFLVITFHRRRLFNQLPQLPKLGVIGRWLLGNIDVYFYAMQHLTIEEGKFKKVCSLEKKIQL